ncbi:MAG: cysteine--tRNA ligase [Bdellovibrionaceae bacterium]|nr:cysteine--tRNA ligase [Pseudobdellovibrionaceae bacterium]
MMRLYNSLTRQKEEFRPLNPPHVKMYVCGPTVYNFLHVGNFRGPVVFNLLRNWLEYRGYRVTYALNFTDVDDKILHRAQQEGVSSEEISERYIREYKTDFARLGLKPHEVNPKVTETMDEIIHFVQVLLQKGKAYVAHGDVLYSIDQFPGYGKLSGRDPQELRTGVRVEVGENKRNPLDFALWKAAKPGETSWPSPWGPGRPGWHIECSAMIHKHLGEQIDIHGGGLDLLFPHHENEIAQSEGAMGHEFVRYWVHVNMLNVSGQKMSKSLGNFITMREFLENHHPEIYKWMILSSHYRSVAEFGDEAISRAVHSLAKIYSALSLADDLLKGWNGDIENDSSFISKIKEAWSKIETSLDDDLNTPEVIAAVHEVLRTFNSQVRRGMKPTAVLIGKAQALKGFFARLGGLMALFQEPPSKFLRELDDILLKKMGLERGKIDGLVVQRSLARKNRDFATSDRLRDELAQMGISVFDSPEGSWWEVTK